MTVSVTTASTMARAILFDMDGTLLGSQVTNFDRTPLRILSDSTPAVVATWEVYARQYSLDLRDVLKTSHGVRTIDNLRRWCGLTDEEALQVNANGETVGADLSQEATNAFEDMIVTEAKRLQSEGKSGLQILPGVSDILDTLDASPTALWAIVTSATPIYASAALPTAGVRPPPKLITAADVTKGKPHPEPYLAGAKALNVDAEKCIVVEDAPSGIKAGIAAGSRVLAVCTSHERAQLEDLGATWIVTDLSKVQVAVNEGLVHLVINES